MWKKIKLILKSLRQYKKDAIVTPFFMIGEAALECALPFVMSMFVDTMRNITKLEDIMTPFPYENGPIQLEISLFYILITLVVMALLSLMFGILGGVFASRASVGLAANLRSDMYKKLETFSFANIDKFSASSLVTRMTTDISTVQMAFQMVIRAVVRAPLMMIFSAVMAFMTGGQMAWIFVCLIPVIGLCLFLIIRVAMKIFRRLFKRYDKLNESVQENITGMRVVKSYVREDYEKEKFNRASDGMTGEFVKAEKIVALNNPVMNTGIHLSNVLIIGLGAYFIGRDIQNGTETLTIGQMSALLTYGIQILMSLMFVSMIMVMLVMSIEGVRRIGEVLEEEPTIKNPENPIMEVPNGEVIFDNVNFKYSETAEKNALENININIKSGQFIGILGSTGSGKTSLVNLISRLYDIQEGSLKVGGHDVKEYDLEVLRNNVAVVLQKNFLFSGTIADNLRWGDLNATQEELEQACKISQAEEFIESFPQKYETRIEQGGSNVSGGQKQRLCIARALLKKPKILILDDSTSAVDTKTDRLIRRGLREDLPQTTKIVIAQRISSIEDADQIIIMEDGKINAIGTHNELLKNNHIYQEIYYTQNNQGGDR
ncbi:MAG: ABC transporter ATP-binding protein [Bacilli bacterium]|nr:ABC transporter ATP-binding protein [Bacilli bacterium]